MCKRFFILSFLLFNFSFFTAAQDTSHLRISLLTCTPGEDLYSTFGHSALRITDSSSNDDLVFNYGTFDFDEPGFYMKFIRGKLMYYLSTEDFNSFSNFYREENRGITEQVLHLTASEKKSIKKLLQENLESENRFYKYDFLFDNCTTRLRDLVEKTADTLVHYGNVLSGKTRFRELIYEYLDYNDKQWSKLGIDLLLGSKTDAIMTNRQVMFLPDYLMKTFDSTTIGNVPVVVSSKSLFETLPGKRNNDLVSNPVFIFSLLLMLIVFLSFSKNNFVQKFITGFDGFIFFTTGLLGILILFMWLGTDHLMCKDNYNLIWALPSNIVAAFYVSSSNKNAKNFFKIIMLINSFLVILWFFLPQHMNLSLLPLVILLIFRSVMITYKQEKY